MSPAVTNIRRERQDAFALSSHQKALQARQKGAFRDEIMPYKTHTPVIDNDSYRITSNTIDQDEGPREDTSLSALAGLKPSFHQHGTVTAGNSSQVSDGAGALLLCSEKALKTYALEPIATFRRLHRCRRAARNHGHWPNTRHTESLASVPA